MSKQKPFKPGDLAVIIAVTNPANQVFVGRVCELINRYHLSPVEPVWMQAFKSDPVYGEPYWHVTGEGLPEPCAVSEQHLMPLSGDGLGEGAHWQAEHPVEQV